MTVNDLAQALSQLVSQGRGDARVMCDGDEVSGFVVREAERVRFTPQGRVREDASIVSLMTDVPF